MLIEDDDELLCELRLLCELGDELLVLTLLEEELLVELWLEGLEGLDELVLMLLEDDVSL